MTLDIFNSTMQASSGVFVVHEPHDGEGDKTVMKVVWVPMLVCSWWRTGHTRIDGIVSQSFQ